MDITLSITKSSVMNEVAKLTSYIGAKILTDDGGNAYDQVFTTNDDYAMLEKYWREAANATAGNLRRFIKTMSPASQGSLVDLEEVFELVLDMPSRYDGSQTETIQSALFNYFINFITSRWLALTYKTDAEYYEKCSVSNMTEILLKLFHKTKPTRPQ